MKISFQISLEINVFYILTSKVLKVYHVCGDDLRAAEDRNNAVPSAERSLGCALLPCRYYGQLGRKVKKNGKSGAGNKEFGERRLPLGS